MSKTYESALESALSELHAAQQLLLDEIAAYPKPIAGCDVQFNQLLSDRKRISDAIQALANSPFIPTPRTLEPGAGVESR